MSQLKQDEWPADGEPTTTESQDRSGEDVRGFGHPSPVPPDADDAVELSNVTPDEQGTSGVPLQPDTNRPEGGLQGPPGPRRAP